MAIIKALESTFGIDVAYHRITAISVNLRTKDVVICVASYLSKEARSQAKDALEEIDIDVPEGDFQVLIKGDILANAYGWLKANVVGFEDATDCFESFGNLSQPEVEENHEISQEEAIRS